MEKFFPPDKPSQPEEFQFYRTTEIAFGHTGYIQFTKRFEPIPEEILREYCFKASSAKISSNLLKGIYDEIEG